MHKQGDFDPTFQYLYNDAVLLSEQKLFALISGLSNEIQFILVAHGAAEQWEFKVGGQNL